MDGLKIKIKNHYDLCVNKNGPNEKLKHFSKFTI